MSMPMGGGGGFQRPALDHAANAVLAAARGRMGPRPPFPPAIPQRLTAEQQAEAINTIAGGGGCPCCGGIHAAEPWGCPRLASFRRDADGMIVEGTYWRDGEYDTSKIVFADSETAEAGGTDG